MQQFWQVGYEATSLQDLLNVMGLSKSSLYQTFGNKHRLFMSCIDYYQRLMAHNLATQLESGDSAIQFLVGLLQDVISEAEQSTHKKGCFLVNSINELCPQDVEASEAAAHGIENMGKVLFRAIERGKREGDINPMSDNHTLVNYLLAQISGLRTMVKAGVDIKILQAVVDMTLKSFR